MTASELITRALRRARILGVDQAASAEDISNGFSLLNDLLDSWWLERLAVYREKQESFAWAAGNASRTIGTGGDFDTVRPVAVLGAFFRVDNVDYPVTVLTDRAQYDSESLKSTQGIPAFLYYDPAYPVGTLYSYPVPNQAMTLYVNTQQRIGSFSSPGETVDLPPGYRGALIDGLAELLCSDYGIEPPAVLVKEARRTKAVLKRLNAPAPVLSIPGALMKPYHFDINRGW